MTFSRTIAKEFSVLLNDLSQIMQLVLFGVVGILIGAVATDGIGGDSRILALGLFWVVFFFLQVLLLENTYRTEWQNGAWIRYKVAGEALTLLSAKLIVLPLIGGIAALPMILVAQLFFQVPPQAVWLLIPLLGAAATLGFVALGMALLPVAEASGNRSLFLPLLLMPLGFPLFLAAAQASLGICDLAAVDVTRWLVWMLSIDALYLALSWFLFDEVLYV